MKNLSISLRTIQLLLFFSLFSISALNNKVNAASFSCNKAYDYAEKMICSHADLSVKDDALAKVYTQAKSITGNSQEFRSLIKQNWYLRKNCSTKQCISNWYSNSTELYNKIIHQSKTCVSEGQKLTLSGTLLRITYPGPPNYESVADGDEPETYWVLQPNKKINCAIDAPNFDNHTKMQLVMMGNEYRDYASLVGKNVTINGELMYSISGHHHTSLLIIVKRIAAK
ncbi:hypothetical protein IEC338SC_0612 [Acinetobacter pittii]|uniref:DUF4431 domain-containing protein n=1 Tax=Acinetobacter pittii TaxID=48296 RepID=A0AB33B7S5_ACIPI|nr:DUF4431 domain-containing protein [Acinetobacter pittii]AMX17788.1 hypothetical protein IEC338SC_0612 [Acinetobacter pittii]